MKWYFLKFIWKYYRCSLSFYVYLFVCFSPMIPSTPWVWGDIYFSSDLLVCFLKSPFAWEETEASEYEVTCPRLSRESVKCPARTFSVLGAGLHLELKPWAWTVTSAAPRHQSPQPAPPPPVSFYKHFSRQLGKWVPEERTLDPDCELLGALALTSYRMPAGLASYPIWSTSAWVPLQGVAAGESQGFLPVMSLGSYTEIQALEIQLGPHPQGPCPPQVTLGQDGETAIH